MAESTYFTGVLASVAGAAKYHLSLHNADATKVVRIYRVLAAGAPTIAVTGLVIPLHAVRFTGAAPSTGSAVTALAAAVNETALASTITSKAGPTTIPSEDTVPFGVGAVSGEETGASSQVALWSFGIDGTKPIELGQNQGIVVKQGALASAGAVHITILFTVV